MGKVISFPQKKLSDNDQNMPINDSDDPVLASFEADKAFLNLVLEWPCFTGISPQPGLRELFDMYYDDELSLSQDCVLEFIFHMHDANSAFDISNALYTWNDDDRNFFILSLNIHAELIDQVKQDEL